MIINRMNMLDFESLTKLSLELFNKISLQIDARIVQELTEITNTNQLSSIILVKALYDALQAKDTEIEGKIEQVKSDVGDNLSADINSLKDRIENNKLNVNKNNDNIVNISNSVNSNAVSISLNNTKINDVNDSNNSNSSFINSINTLIDELSSKVAALTHLGIETVVGPIESVVEPKEDMLYFQKDNEEDPTWVLYIYVENIDNHWIKIGGVDIDLSNYWSKDDIEEIYQALGIKDNITMITKEELFQLVNAKFDDFIDSIFIIKAYEDSECTKPINDASPLIINALRSANDEVYLNIEHFTTNQIDDIKIDINDIFRSINTSKINGSLIKLKCIRRNFDSIESHVGTFPLTLSVGNIVKSIKVDYDFKSDIKDVIDKVNSIVGIENIDNFDNVYAGNCINSIILEFELNPEYQGTIDADFKTTDETLSQIQASVNFTDNVMTITLDSEKLGMLEDGKCYEAIIEFTCHIDDGNDVVINKDFSIIGFDINKNPDIIDNNNNFINQSETIHVPMNGSKVLKINKLFKNKFIDLKDLSVIKSISVIPIEKNVPVDIKLGEDGDIYAYVTFSKSENNKYENSYPISIEIDFDINGIDIHSSRLVNIYFDASPASYFTFDESTGTITGLTKEGKAATDIVIPSTINDVAVTSIGNDAFKECKSLISVTIPESVTSIENNTFQNCVSLKSLTISEGVTNIGDRAFWNCNSLTEVNLPNTIKSIGYAGFYICSSLSKVNLPEGLTSIGQWAFTKCPLTEVIIPRSLTFLGDSAFRESNITTITIPNTLTTLEQGAFYKCSLIEEVIISSGVKETPSHIFYGCTSLKKVYIPLTLTKITTQTFYDCTSLTDVYYEGSQTDWSSIEIGTYNDVLNNVTIHYNYKK